MLRTGLLQFGQDRIERLVVDFGRQRGDERLGFIGRVRTKGSCWVRQSSVQCPHEMVMLPTQHGAFGRVELLIRVEETAHGSQARHLLEAGEHVEVVDKLLDGPARVSKAPTRQLVRSEHTGCHCARDRPTRPVLRARSSGACRARL